MSQSTTPTLLVFNFVSRLHHLADFWHTHATSEAIKEGNIG
jgi:hypothetical protein